MKKLLVVMLGFALLTPILSNAADAEKKEQKKEMKALRKELLEKYDTNKDGKLDKEEKAKISADDKEKAEKAGLIAAKKKKEAKEKEAK
jgi:hypothetical protein